MISEVVPAQSQCEAGLGPGGVVGEERAGSDGGDSV